MFGKKKREIARLRAEIELMRIVNRRLRAERDDVQRELDRLLREALKPAQRALFEVYE